MCQNGTTTPIESGDVPVSIQPPIGHPHDHPLLPSVNFPDA